MLNVRIDLVPHGDASARQTVGGLEISNDGTGDDAVGIYDVTFADGLKVRLAHNRNDDVYKLLFLALSERQKVKEPSR